MYYVTFPRIVIALSIMALFFLGQIISKANQASQTPEALAQRSKQQIRDRLYLDALASCRKSVENAAKYDLRWTDSMIRPAFVRYSGWEEDSIIFRGDAAEAQNGFGGWVRVNYICVFNPKTKYATASIEAGRLGGG
jgi:hypothetical protein